MHCRPSRRGHQTSACRLARAGCLLGYGLTCSRLMDCLLDTARHPYVHDCPGRRRGCTEHRAGSQAVLGHSSGTALRMRMYLATAERAGFGADGSSQGTGEASVWTAALSQPTREPLRHPDTPRNNTILSFRQSAAALHHGARFDALGAHLRAAGQMLSRPPPVPRRRRCSHGRSPKRVRPRSICPTGRCPSPSSCPWPPRRRSRASRQTSWKPRDAACV